MSDRLMERFREDAERIVRVPAVELIEEAGRRRRRRHRAVAGVVAGVVTVGTVGVMSLLRGDDTIDRPQPAEEPTSLVTPYPGPMMTTLEEGTYELTPSFDGSRPRVRFNVPAGWNAWEGPNRFEGMGPHVTDNEDVLAQGVDWYLGLLVLEVDQMPQRDCTTTDVSGRSAEELARRIGRLPGLDVTSGPESTVRFGHPALHLRLRGNDGTCPWFFRGRFGPTGGAEAGDTYDAWVVDVGDRPLLVWSDWSRRAPRADVSALLRIVDSIEVVDPE